MLNIKALAQISFQDILRQIFDFKIVKKMPKVITPVFNGTGTKDYQVIYTSSQNSTPNIMSLAEIVFEKSCKQDSNVNNC